MAKAYHVPVVIFYDQNEEYLDEMSGEEFDQFLAGDILLDAYAASVVKGCFCIVGNGLKLRSLVLFLLPINEHGQVDGGFNVPLLYLAQHAGFAGDLGDGPIRVASRGQCPVPWHSLNLWDSASKTVTENVQKRIYRNKLGLKPVLIHGIEFDDDPSAGPELDDAADTAVVSQVDAEVSASTAAEFAQRLEAVFGTQGKVSMQDMIRLHAEQLAEAKQDHRDALDQQQDAHMARMRAARKEIHDLKVALRQEQSRNRRLQEMLRGDPR